LTDDLDVTGTRHTAAFEMEDIFAGVGTGDFAVDDDFVDNTGECIRVW
jgi:hypothetical protein